MLGFGPPRYSLKLGPRRAVWGEFSRDWRRRARAGFRTVELPEGILAPSPVDPNVRDVEALKSRLRALIGTSAGRPVSPRPIVLVLPDLCVRALLLEMDAMPKRADEREAFIRWRLAKETNVPLKDVRVVFQVVGPRAVLAVIVGEQVCRQYETLCEDLGLVPVRMEVTSFLMAHLLRGVLPGGEPVGWVSLLDEGFTLLIYRAGRPSFLRIKLRASPVLNDLAVSLAFDAESHPGAPLRRLYVLSEEAEPDMTTAISKELDLDVLAVGTTLVQRAWSVALDEAAPPSALPALLALAPARRPGLLAVDLGGKRLTYVARACAALALVSLLLAGLIAWKIQEARAIRTQALEVEQALARVQAQDRRIQLQAQAEGVDLSDAALGRLADEVAFANDLIAKRTFSWTRFLSDLEETVPAYVSISSIRPDFKGAVIAIGGTAVGLKELTAFIIRLEDHPAFANANLLQHRVQDNDVVEFNLTVRYQPHGR